MDIESVNTAVELVKSYCTKVDTTIQDLDNADMTYLNWLISTELVLENIPYTQYEPNPEYLLFSALKKMKGK